MTGVSQNQVMKEPNLSNLRSSRATQNFGKLIVFLLTIRICTAGFGVYCAEIGQVLPQNDIYSDGLRQPVANTTNNSLMANDRLEQNLSDASGVGKFTKGTKSRFPNRDIYATIQKAKNTSITSEDILKESYNKPIIFGKRPHLKINTSTQKNNSGSTVSTRAASEAKPCKKVVAGVLCADNDVTDYPLEMAKKLSKERGFKSRYSLYFGTELIPKSEQDPHFGEKPVNVSGIDTRKNSNPNRSLGRPMCSVHETLNFRKPTILMNRNKIWRYILQYEETNLTQIIHTEVCLNENKPCHAVDSSYTSWCSQKYAYRKLVWITNENEYGVDEFEVPSCCSCRYHKILDERDDEDNK